MFQRYLQITSDIYNRGNVHVSTFPILISCYQSPSPDALLEGFLDLLLAQNCDVGPAKQPFSALNHPFVGGKSF